jgi:hypothetical protein
MKCNLEIQGRPTYNGLFKTNYLIHTKMCVLLLFSPHILAVTYCECLQHIYLLFTKILIFLLCCKNFTATTKQTDSKWLFDTELLNDVVIWYNTHNFISVCQLLIIYQTFCEFDQDNYCYTYCNVLGVLFMMELYCTPELNTLQLNTASNSWNTRTRPTRTDLEHSLL